MVGKRYSELDWLRVCLILAVFLHHVFMPFNGDGWHVMNNQSSKLLDDIMVYFEQLRLQTLFFIAGAGSLLLLNKMTAWAFVTSKFHRLLVPLIVGMMLIVPPQNYFENKADYADLFNAYQQLILSFDANHLWFIEFLLVFMLFAVPLRAVLGSRLGQLVREGVERISVWQSGLFSLVLVLIFLRGGLKLLFPSDDHSIENISVSLFFSFFFVAGMCFIQSPKIWQAIADHRRINLYWLIFSSGLFYFYYFMPDISQYASLTTRWQIWWLVCSLVSWSGLLVLVGYASVWFKHSPRWLRKANELIYPFYILHQTVIVVLAFYIVQWSAGIATKSLSLLISSFLLCSLLCYFVIKPVGFLRYLFGLKSQKMAD